MSRSYKKNPVTKSTNSKKFAKRQSNKRVRKADVDNGGSFKKLFESWEINDYVTYAFRESEKEWIENFDKKVGKVRK